MNLFQLCGALQTAIRAMTWSTAKVFASASVRVTAGPQERALRELVMPVCLITPGDATADPQFGECPQVQQVRIVVTLITAIPNDRFGEAPLMGANAAAADSSKGKGLFEIEPKLFAAIDLLTAQEGVTIVFSHAGSAQAAPDTDVGYVVAKDYYFTAFITTEAT